ncbi:phospholipase A [bacterium]|nr:phospholipase A [bacterium]
MFEKKWFRWLLWGIILVVGWIPPAGATEIPDSFFHSLEGYKPVYILNSWFLNHEGSDQGFENQELAIQFSLKKRIINCLYFGYSHKAFWQIYDHANSRPFREQNYNPELFLEFQDLWGADRVQVGLFEHESNGDRARYDASGNPVNRSRTWDRTYLYLQKNVVPWLTFSLKSWIVISPREKEYRAYFDDNPDMQQYLGSGELGLVVDLFRASLALMLRRGWLAGTETVRTEVRIPFSSFLDSEDNGNALYLQAFSGYGDSLIDYNRRITRFAAGISFR